MEKQKTIKEEALAYESPAKTRNITELKKIPTELITQEESFKDKDDKDVTIQYVEVEGEKYRLPKSVLISLKAILEDNSELKFFKVIK